MKIAGLTGHRPQSLPCKYDETHPFFLRKVKMLTEYLQSGHGRNITTILSGAALGWDTIGAEVAYRCGIPWQALVPFRGQESVWPLKSQDRYKKMLMTASEVRVICPGGYSAWKMLRRDEVIAKEADLMLVLWNPEKKSGGTYHTVATALSMQKPILNFWGDTPEYVTIK